MEYKKVQLKDENGNLECPITTINEVFDTDGLPIKDKIENMLYAESVSTEEVESFPNALFDTDIVNALDSTETKKPLSANQGSVLKSEIDVINASLTQQAVNVTSTENCTVNGHIFKIGKLLILHILVAPTDITQPVHIYLDGVNMKYGDIFATNYSAWNYESQIQIQMITNGTEIYTTDGGVPYKYIRIDTVLVMN